MTLILDSGGVSALAGQRARLAELRKRNQWPPVVPSVVLVEALTGDHRRDFHTNRLLGMCIIKVVDEHLAREASRIRTATGRAGEIAATDAIVAAQAARADAPNILTSDPDNIRSLVVHCNTAIAITPT